MIAFFWAALIVTLLCAAIGAIVCVRKSSALLAASGRLSEHPLFATIRSADALGERVGRTVETLSSSSQKFGASLRVIGEALAAVAAYAAFVDSIAKSVEELLEVFVPRLRGAEPT
jgi:hypothetical protein